MQDAERLGEELVLGHLEKLVARVVLDEVLESLFLVAAGRRLGPAKNSGHLIADQRHRCCGLVIGLGGEQSDEPHLARRAALGVVPFDAHVIHVGPPVDPALDVRLGDRDGGTRKQPLFDIGQDDGGLVGAAQDMPRRVAQDAQSILGLVKRLFGGVFAVRQPGIFVDPGAEEDELVRLEPSQKRKFLRSRVVSRQLQFGEGLAHQADHGREVVHCGANVLQGFGDALRQGLFAIGADGLKDDLDHRFATDVAIFAADASAIAADRDDGVEQRTDHQALFGDLPHDRVHKERGVVLNDLQSIQLRMVFADHREQADHRPASTAAVAVAPEVGQVGRMLSGG